MIDEKALEAAARAYCLEIDVDPDMPHALASGAPAWWAVEAPYIRAAILAYESAKQKGEAEGWRDIESDPPPEDGEPYLFNDPVLGRIYGYFSALDEGDEEDTDEGYWVFQDFVGDCLAGVEPTHWRPLPEPPTMLSAGGEG